MTLPPLLASTAVALTRAEPLSPVGAAIMLTSVAFVTVLTLACYRRILAPTPDDG
jgi:hypothetical protein